MASTTTDLAHRTDYLKLTALLEAQDDISFFFHGIPQNQRVQRLAEGLEDALIKTGRGMKAHREQDARLIVHFASPDNPVPYRRRSRAVFVATILEGPRPTEPFKSCYPYLIRTLSNVLLYFAEDQVHFMTPERGHVRLPYAADPKEGFYKELVSRLMPIASSHLIIDNEFDDDLPPHLGQGDANTRAFLEVGQQLDALDLLPAPFDLEELLSPGDLRHLRRLYKMGGLSHGNMSQRLDETRFWMSASGVDKSNMTEIGRDILLVKGFSPDRLSMALSVPPGVKARRVSVDAIEHWMIYSEHPQIGAILHVHAWIDGVRSTDVAYPCGTVELAYAVASLLRQEPDPERAIIGLKNHGLTITGESLPEIMSRVGHRLLRQIPME